MPDYAKVSGDERFIRETVLDGSGDKVVIIGTNADGSTITGLTVQNGDDGLSINSDITVVHNRFVDNVDGVSFESSGGLCQYNLFEGNKDDGIDLDEASGPTIKNNVIRNNSEDGIEIRLHPYAGSETLNIDIIENEITGNLEDGIQLIDYIDPSNRTITISRNLIQDNAKVGVGCMAYDRATEGEDFQGTRFLERIVVTGNTFNGNPYGLTCGGNTVTINNIFANCSGTAVRNVDGDAIVAFSLFWNNSIDHEGSNMDTNGTNIFSMDPLLGEDGRSLNDRSPAIDKGATSFDFLGETVFSAVAGSYNGAAPDIGCFESD